MAVEAPGLDSLPFYYWYELQHGALGPFRADATRLFYQNPINPLTHTTFGKSMAAGCELFERVTRRYGKPDWEIHTTLVGGERVAVHPEVVWERPVCRLAHFRSE